MTFNRNQPTDRAETKNLLNNIPNQMNKPNWLGHLSGNAEIDYELFDPRQEMFNPLRKSS